MATLKDLEKTLDDFNKKHPRPGIPRLKLEKPFTDVIAGTEASWPNNLERGIYIFFDAEMNVTYIGKASINVIGARLNQYFDNYWNVRERNRRKASDCRYIATIVVPYEHSFEVPAIEEYLTEYLRPRHNIIRREK